MLNKVDYKENYLFIDSTYGCQRINVGHKVWKILSDDNRIIVLVDPEKLYDTELNNRNVLCFNEQGKVLWQVEDPDIYRSGKIKTEAPFTSIRIVDSKLEGGTWDGFDIYIDVQTGKLLPGWEFTK